MVSTCGGQAISFFEVPGTGCLEIGISSIANLIIQSYLKDRPIVNRSALLFLYRWLPQEKGFCPQYFIKNKVLDESKILTIINQGI